MCEAIDLILDTGEVRYKKQKQANKKKQLSVYENRHAGKIPGVDTGKGKSSSARITFLWSMLPAGSIQVTQLERVKSWVKSSSFDLSLQASKQIVPDMVVQKR